jgi:hypothetical protein
MWGNNKTRVSFYIPPHFIFCKHCCRIPRDIFPLSLWICKQAEIIPEAVSSCIQWTGSARRRNVCIASPSIFNKVWSLSVPSPPSSSLFWGSFGSRKTWFTSSRNALRLSIWSTVETRKRYYYHASQRDSTRALTVAIHGCLSGSEPPVFSGLASLSMRQNGALRV